MAKENKGGPALPFLRWQGKGGSGLTVMHDRGDDNSVTPWSGERLAQELDTHSKAGNKVTFGAVHGGNIVGEAAQEKPAAKKTVAKKPAAKPAAKAPAKPAAKPVPKKK
jgi:hypothetical protein